MHLFGVCLCDVANFIDLSTNEDKTYACGVELTAGSFFTKQHASPCVFDFNGISWIVE